MITLDPKQILLFPETEEDFENNGIGHLSDAISCVVTEELNGGFELELVYPISGNHFSEIGQRSIIFAKARPNDEGQPFRVYRITKPLNGIVTVYAEHISYDLSGIVDEPFTAGSAAAAMSALENYAVGDMPFSFWTDKTTTATMTVATPSSVRSLLGGVQGSVLDTYGGEWEFDRFTAKLHNHRGQDRGFSIRYGKNLTDIQQEENCSNCYTAVYPYWKASDGSSMVTLSEKTVPVTGTFSYTKILVHDFSQDFETAPTQQQLRTRTSEYITANKIGVPKVSIDVSFVQLSQSEEYKGQAILEQLYLGDTVSVEFEKLGVSASAKVNKTVFNSLLDRYDSVSVGDSKTNIADTIALQQAEIDNVDLSGIMGEVEAAALNASKLITGNRGGYVVIHSSTGANTPDEILIMDTPDITTAQKVWRWNNSGLGYSSTGYSGTYTSAWTIAGAFNADFITAGTMSANRIRSGTLESTNGVSVFNLADGNIRINFGSEFYMILGANGIEFWSTFDTGVPHLIGYFKGFTTGSIQSDRSYLEATDMELNLTNAGKAFSVLPKDGATYYLARNDVDDGSAYSSMSYYESIDEDDNVHSRMGYDHNSGYGFLQLFGSNAENIRIKGSSSGGYVRIYGDNGVDLSSGSNGGYLSLSNSGSICAQLTANSNGGSLSLGDGDDGLWTIATYHGSRDVYADHFHFSGKSDGLITSSALDASECSGYIVVGQPTDRGYYSSVFIPSAIAEGRNWQIADETNYILFTISGGRATKQIGSSTGSGSIYATYAIR